MPSVTTPTLPRGEAPLRCLNKACKYAKPSETNGCSIFSGAAIADCREVELKPLFNRNTPKTKGSHK